MGLFALDYQNVPGECIYAEGGLKFRADEKALCRYFSPILPYVSLNDLIGEAVFWVLLPSSLAIWIFPFLLYYCGAVFAIITAAIFFIFVGIGHQHIYLKPLNYLVFVFGNRLLQLIGYIAWAVIFILDGSITNILHIGAWFVFFAFGLGDMILGLLPILFGGRIFSLPLSDQVLRTVGIYHGAKLGMDPLTWRMYDRDEDRRT